MSKYLVYKVITPLGYKVDLWTSASKKSPTYADLFADEEMRIMKIEATGAKVVKEETKPLEATTQSQERFCGTCGEKMDFRSGTSKTGKPWKGWFCPKDKTHEPIWEKV
jgi:hypothetical protein